MSILFAGGAGGLLAVTSSLASSAGQTSVQQPGCQQWSNAPVLGLSRLRRVAA